MYINSAQLFIKTSPGKTVKTPAEPYMAIGLYSDTTSIQMKKNHLQLLFDFFLYISTPLMKLYTNKNTKISQGNTSKKLHRVFC